VVVGVMTMTPAADPQKRVSEALSASEGAGGGPARVVSLVRNEAGAFPWPGPLTSVGSAIQA
jgi:hypothetical protein